MERINTGNKNKVILHTFRVCLAISMATILFHHQSVLYRMDNDDSIDVSHKTPTPTIAMSRQNRPNKKQATPQTQTQTSTTKQKQTPFVPCPKEFCKLVWMKGSPSQKLYEPIYRAFHSRGYSVTENVTKAHFLIMDQPNHPRDFYETLQPWQRYNQLPNTNKWDDKDEMALTMNRYYSERRGKISHLHSFPESYVLHLPDGLEAFRTRLSEENGGMDVPWVLKKPKINQGKGIVILPPRSDELGNIVDIVKLSSSGNKKKQERLVVQKYICDEMTYGGRKFDVRVFWAVASVDPLVVLYHTEQNYARIGHALYDESNLGNSTTRSHLTTHTFGSTETKATWDEFRESIEKHVFGSESNYRDRFSKSKYDSTATNDQNQRGVLETIEAIHSDPFLHVQNQMKTVIGHLANAYKNITFHGRSMTAENGFTSHAADMIIDNNLDVYIIEGTDGPGRDEDYDFRIRMHDELLGSLVDVMEEVTLQQEEGWPLNVSTMKEKGVLGGYEVVYNDGWFMDYRFQRLPKRECMGNHNRSNNTTARIGKPTDTKSALSPTREVVPATFMALPKSHHNQPNNNSNSNNSKTFWMNSRTTRTSEPVARSLRRNGWTPVDSPEVAQLVYHTKDEYGQYEDFSRPWQWVSQFPSQYSFFSGDHLKYLDFSRSRSISETFHVCQPVMHKNRPLEAIVYWLVLSLDPLIVLFHDGFLYFPYSRDDENEFLELPERDGKAENVWKGSWRAFEHYVNATYADVAIFGKSNATAAAAAILLDPMSHVRNQMKASMVEMAQGFSKHTERANLEQSTYSSFALFYAKFQVDRNLNIFATDAYYSYIKGEDYAEIVSLHDDIYGSAFRLLEYANTTSLTRPIGDDPQKEILGNYEWLIRPDANASKTEPWKFSYDWKYKAKGCFQKQ